MISIDSGSKSERIELITTRQVLPTGSKPAWLLGEWARPAFYSGDLFCMPHHWEDSKKKASDYEYLDDLHARVLVALSRVLNELHGVERSIRSWNVLIGYWLMRALSALLDRWETVRLAAETGHSFDLLVSSLTHSNLTPKNTSEALSWFHSDWWNEAIFLLIARQFTEFHALETEPTYTPVNRRLSAQFWVRSSLAVLRKAAGKAIHKNSETSSAGLFLIETGLSQKLMNGVVKVGGNRVAKPHFPAVLRYPSRKAPRNWRPEWSTQGDYFELWLQIMLPEIMPTGYVENFSYLDKLYSSPIPEKPFTSITKSAHFQNEGFKFWFSRNADQTGRLAVISHGGGPSFDMNGGQRWERNLSDRYLVSGPADDLIGEHTRSIGKITNILSGQWKSSGHALLVSTLVPRIDSDIRAMPVASQMPRVFDDQAELVTALPNEVREGFRVRLYPKESRGWDQRAEWKKRVPDVVFGSEGQAFEQAVAASRIVVVPYRGSTYIQTLHANVPTIIFFSSLWPIEGGSRAFFSMLSDVGIFHSKASTAAKKIVEVWPDVEKWWFSAPVQDAVGAWNAAYAHTYENPVARILEQVDFFEDPLQSRQGAN